MDIIIMVILLVLLASLRAFPVALVGFFTPSPPRASRGPYHSYPTRPLSPSNVERLFTSLRRRGFAR
jgi:hypothetical protein